MFDNIWFEILLQNVHKEFWHGIISINSR